MNILLITTATTTKIKKAIATDFMSTASINCHGKKERDC